MRLSVPAWHTAIESCDCIMVSKIGSLMQPPHTIAESRQVPNLGTCRGLLAGGLLLGGICPRGLNVGWLFSGGFLPVIQEPTPDIPSCGYQYPSVKLLVRADLNELKVSCLLIIKLKKYWYY